ncbi:MAG: hypothetical protein D6776_05860 [Planctomycetota bacterium]|nr:MAG: hypothetical protein D6776_05860 [Planctomycetota bacterium]
MEPDPDNGGGLLMGIQGVGGFAPTGGDYGVEFGEQPAGGTAQDGGASSATGAVRGGSTSGATGEIGASLLEARLAGASDGRDVDLPFGGALHVTSSGEVLYEPPEGMETEGLERQGFTWAGETGFMALPARTGRASRAAGDFPLPFDGELHVLNDGEVLYEPPEGADTTALEQQGFRWAGETGYLSLPGAAADGEPSPGAYRLPGGGTLAVGEDGAMRYEPADPDMAQALEMQGFTPAGETGGYALPRKSGPEAAQPGYYQIGGGGGLQVLPTGEVLVDAPDAASANQLEAMGFQWAGETGYLSLP